MFVYNSNKIVLKKLMSCMQVFYSVSLRHCVIILSTDVWRLTYQTKDMDFWEIRAISKTKRVISVARDHLVVDTLTRCKYGDGSSSFCVLLLLWLGFRGGLW